MFFSFPLHPCVPLNIFRAFFLSLLDPKYYLLPLLGSKFPLDAAVGVNGRVWVSCKEVKQTIAVVRCIDLADPEGGGKSAKDVEKFFRTLDV